MLLFPLPLLLLLPLQNL